MPELELCVYCKKTIKPDDDFVKAEPAALESRKFGEVIHQQYAHAKCHDQMVALETH